MLFREALANCYLLPFLALMEFTLHFPQYTLSIMTAEINYPARRSGWTISALYYCSKSTERRTTILVGATINTKYFLEFCKFIFLFELETAIMVVYQNYINIKPYFSMYIFDF